MAYQDETINILKTVRLIHLRKRVSLSYDFYVSIYRETNYMD